MERKCRFFYMKSSIILQETSGNGKIANCPLNQAGVLIMQKRCRKTGIRKNSRTDPAEMKERGYEQKFQ